MQRALHGTGQLAEVDDLDEFPVRATEVLRETIPCEHCGYNAIDLESGTAVVIANPSDVVFEGGPEALAELGHENPLIVRALAGVLAVQRLSDHITTRQLHRTQIYRDIYRRVGLEYQLGVRLPNVGRRAGRGGQFVGLSLARARRDFSDADKLMLDLFRPHFAATLARLHQIALTRAVVAGVQADRNRWIVLVDSADVVAWASEAAEHELGAITGERLMLGPELTVRRVADAYPGLDALHISRPVQLDRDALRRGLGLTARQSEVLELAIRGRSADQIADALTLSRRTVEKHFEAIYAQLGVRTRAQAVAAATAAMAIAPAK